MSSKHNSWHNMVRVNKKQIAEDLRGAAWRRFWEILNKSKSEKELSKNLRKFLTDSEILLLEKRLVISVLLDKKLSYRNIGEIADVTRTTISFVKQNLKRKPRVSRNYNSLGKTKKKKLLPLFLSRAHRGRHLYKAFGG